ncbi:Uncharacterized protein APZ42_005739, partial [Daphnia magna]
MTSEGDGPRLAAGPEPGAGRAAAGHRPDPPFRPGLRALKHDVTAGASRPAVEATESQARQGFQRPSASSPSPEGETPWDSVPPSTICTWRWGPRWSISAAGTCRCTTARKSMSTIRCG